MEKKQEDKKETLANIGPRFFEQKASYDQHTNPSELHSDLSNAESKIFNART